jgi:mono/diheme cytochrome c family protein
MKTVFRVVYIGLTISLSAATLALAAGDAAAGKAVYNKACKGCHGADGTPNPAIAKSMKVPMAHLGDSAVQGMSDADLKGAIENGKGKMKAITSVKGKSVDDVIAYMRTFKK